MRSCEMALSTPDEIWISDELVFERLAAVWIRLSPGGRSVMWHKEGRRRETRKQEIETRKQETRDAMAERVTSTPLR